MFYLCNSLRPKLLYTLSVIALVAVCAIVEVAVPQGAHADANKRYVYIYQDDGTSGFYFSYLKSDLSFLNRGKETYTVKPINAAEVIDGAWKQNAALFIICPSVVSNAWI